MRDRGARRYEGLSPATTVRCWRWQEVARAGARAGGGPAARQAGAAAQAEENQVISVRDVTAFYQSKEILHGVSASLCEHRCLALVGESGSGKTTLARCIAGLHPFKIEGDIELRASRWRATRVAARAPTRQAIQYIFQSPYSSLNPRKTIAPDPRAAAAHLLRLTRDETRGAHGEACSTRWRWMLPC